MIDHVSIGVSDLDRAGAFYRVALAPLGLTCLVVRPTQLGFGRRYPELWLNHRPGMAAVPADTGSHVCLRAPDEAAVAAFHAAALTAGGVDDGAPGPRRAQMTPYVAAFVRDPDGHRLEVATFPARTPGASSAT